MSQSMTIELPATTYRHLEQIAQRQNSSISKTVEVLVAKNERIPSLPYDIEREMAALTHLSDESLWVLAQQTWTPEQRERWDNLNDKVKRLGEQLSDVEQEQQDHLLALYDYFVLRRAFVLGVLLDRGKDVSPLLVVPEL